MQRSDARIGMRVVFGRSGPNAEKSIGKITKTNPTSAKVELLEERGTRGQYKVGSLFGVPYSLMEPEPASGNKEEVINTLPGLPESDTFFPGGAIVPGVTTFRSSFADSNPLWKVLKLGKRGRNAWICEIVNEPIVIDGKTYDGEWAGNQKAFLTHEIINSIKMSKLFEGYANEHDQFYASLKPGQTIHYHNGFDNWVRCTVVVKDGKNVLKPIALVGEWRSHDLPRRMQDGSIYLGYHSQKIADGETMTPNASNLFEHTCKPRNGINPNTLSPIDLALPEMAPEEAKVAAMWAKVRKIHEITSASQGNPIDILNAVEEAL